MTERLELILLGTGTSSCVPSIGCLTSPKGCLCCKSTLDGSILGKRNIRRNTSAVLKIPAKAGETRGKTLLIDCGKSFYTAALEHWPRKGLREIDAVLLTHPHTDAVGGLDDLRGWTLHQHVQRSIDIYCNQFTFDEISRSAAYLTDSSKATGGGDVPQFVWHVFDEHKPLEILGIVINALPVHHGKFFSTPPRPYNCLGFLFDSSIAYISDVSYVPEDVWTLLASKCQLPKVPKAINTLSINVEQAEKPVLQALIIDCLRIESHTSHFGLPQAVATARRLGAIKSYLVGFGHATSHATWTLVCEALSLPVVPESTLPFQYSSTGDLVLEPKSDHIWQVHGGSAAPGAEDPEVYKQHALRLVNSFESAREGVWIRPGCDGMTITTGEEGGVRDDVY